METRVQVRTNDKWLLLRSQLPVLAAFKAESTVRIILAIVAEIIKKGKRWEELRWEELQVRGRGRKKEEEPVVHRSAVPLPGPFNIAMAVWKAGQRP